MYLARIQLDPCRRNTMRAFASPNLFHGAIEHACSGPGVRKLWRVDTLADKTYLLVLCPDKADFSSVAAQFGEEGKTDGWEIKAYEPLLNRIENGGVWHFRLTANPTVSKASSVGERGKVLGHVTPAYQKQWLMRRAEKHGFSLLEDGFDVVQSQWLRFRKGTDGGRPVTLLSVTYEGVLTITDAAVFQATLTEGVGRGKAYGMGMLTVAMQRR